jgi:hypothetical protein
VATVLGVHTWLFPIVLTVVTPFRSGLNTCELNTGTPEPKKSNGGGIYIVSLNREPQVRQANTHDMRMTLSTH